MKGLPVKKGTSRELTEEQRAEIEALAALPDEEIDTSDIPEILDWSGARRGLLHRRWPVASGRWPVVGGQWSVAGD